MDDYSADVTYAYAQLGLAQGASLEEIKEVLENTASYRFSTKSRIEDVRRLVDFFKVRSTFGSFEQSFAEIRKAYHSKAMELHPDRNKGNLKTEDQLKAINASFALIEEIQRQAKEYYAQSEEVRREIEDEARALRERAAPQGAPRAAAPEVPSGKPTSSAPPQNKSQAPQKSGAGGVRKYFAASVPRSIRTARLSHLPLRTVIGFRAIARPNDISLIMDIIMLPEDQFVRAKSWLSAPETVLPALQYGKFSPPYILKDTKEVLVPEGEQDPENFAKEYFKKEFGV